MVAKKTTKKNDENKIESTSKKTNTISKNKVETKKLNIKNNLKSNPWMLSTVALAIILIVISILNIVVSPDADNVLISSDKAGELILEFAEAQGLDAEIVSVDYEGGLYGVVVSISGQEYPALYITNDGKNIVNGQLVDFDEILEQTSAQAQQTAPEAQQTAPEAEEIPKSDKPIVDLFIMSHCPYGTQVMKGMVPAIRALGDSVDFNLRFVNYAMHAEKEVKQELDMYCIREEQEDKLLDYLECFLGTTSGSEEEGKNCLVEVEVDVKKLDTCVAKAYDEFKVEAALNAGDRYPAFKADDALNVQYKVGGSPTLIINGVSAPYGRSSASYLDGICSTFNDVPDVCNTEVSSATPSPGFGWEGTGANSNAQC